MTTPSKTTQQAVGVEPPKGLAPGTRENWIPWRMKVCGWTRAEAEAQFLLYEQRMNSAAWERYYAAIDQQRHAAGG